MEHRSMEKNGGGQNKHSSASRRRIRWVHDDRLIKTKYFRVNDQPKADGLSEIEVRNIREKVLKDMLNATLAVRRRLTN